MNSAINRRLILALGIPFPAAHILLGLANIGRVATFWPYLTAMGVCLALMTVVALPGLGRAMPRRHAAIVVVGTVLMDVLVQSVLPTGQHPGYAAWHSGAIEMILVTVALRNHIPLAWTGIVSFAFLDFTGSMIHGLSIVDGLAMVLTPLMWVVIATWVSLALRRNDEQIHSYTVNEQMAVLKLAKEHARQLSQSEWATSLDLATRPLMEKIAAGPLSDVDRQECFLLEAYLRDQIRGQILATPEVLTAARAARTRGVRVDIFDDRRAQMPDALLSEAAAQLAKVLQASMRGVVKGRALPPGAGVAVTILAFDEENPDDELYLEIAEPTRTG